MLVVVNNPTDTDEGSARFQIGRIRVWPGKTEKYTSEEVRKYIKHPLGNIAFRQSVNDSVEWPFEQFTKRRIKDGTVLVNDPAGLPKSDEVI